MINWINVRKKPVTVKAYKWDGIKYGLVNDFNTDKPTETCTHCGHLLAVHGSVKTLEGSHIVCPGDYIIKGIKGEIYPCKPDIFNATYDILP